MNPSPSSQPQADSPIYSPQHYMYAYAHLNLVAAHELLLYHALSQQSTLSTTIANTYELDDAKLTSSTSQHVHSPVSRPNTRNNANGIVNSFICDHLRVNGNSFIKGVKSSSSQGVKVSSDGSLRLSETIVFDWTLFRTLFLGELLTQDGVELVAPRRYNPDRPVLNYEISLNEVRVLIISFLPTLM